MQLEPVLKFTLETQCEGFYFVVTSLPASCLLALSPVQNHQLIHLVPDLFDLILLGVLQPIESF